MSAERLSARLSLSAQHRLALSLPQSYCLNPERSPTAPSSEGAEGAAAPCTESAQGSRELRSVYPQQGGQGSSQSFAAAKRRQMTAPLASKGSQVGAAEFAAVGAENCAPTARRTPPHSTLHTPLSTLLTSHSSLLTPHRPPAAGISRGGGA